MGEEPLKHTKNQSAGKLLQYWRGVQQRRPELFRHLRVWGQPAAWADQVIQTWVSEYIRELYPQAIVLCDCLGAAWAPEVLAQTWINQQLQIPHAPGATSYLQTLDTHLHALFKAYLVQAKTRLLDLIDQHNQKHGEKRSSSWGPEEVLHVLDEALEKLFQNNQNIPLLASLQNQLFIFRPDAQGNLALVDDQAWTREQKVSRKPVGRGICSWTADQRVDQFRRWEGGEPPEPDWTQLDNLGNYLHQMGMPAEPEPEALVIDDFRFDDLDLTPEQVHMLRPVEDRLASLPEVPGHIATRQEAKRRHDQRLTRRKTKSRWAGTLSRRLSSEASQKWRKELASVKGDVASFKQLHTPEARGVKSVVRQRRHRSGRFLASAKKKGPAGPEERQAGSGAQGTLARSQGHWPELRDSGPASARLLGQACGGHELVPEGYDDLVPVSTARPG